MAQEPLVPVGKSAEYYRTRLVNTLLRKNALQKELTEQKHFVKWVFGALGKVRNKIEDFQDAPPAWALKQVAKQVAKRKGAGKGDKTTVKSKSKGKGKDTTEKKPSPNPPGYVASFATDKAGELWPTWVKSGSDE